MIVETKNRKYKVRFHRRNNFLKVDGVCFDTFCQIFLLEENTVAFEDRPRVAMGVAWQNPKDRYNKIIGKKIALGRALDGLYPNFLKISKELRKVFWDAFYKEFGRWN